MFPRRNRFRSSLYYPILLYHNFKEKSSFSFIFPASYYAAFAAAPASSFYPASSRAASKPAELFLPPLYNTIIT